MTGRPRVEGEHGGGGGDILEVLFSTAVSLVLDPDDDQLNHSRLNTTAVYPTNGSEVKGKDIVPHIHLPYQVLVTFFYIFGILGNIAALYIITKNETQRYKKQTFMLRCLAGNDLVALLGSFVQMYVRLYLPNPNKKLLCASRVVFRAFGLGSGCVALVMAVERWLALTHPFTYQKHVTHAVIRRAILGLWTFNLLLVCAPFAGFGLWYDESLQTPCARYRLAINPLDRAYAYLVFAYGMVMCALIVCCNLSVIRVLCRMRERLLPRRHSRASCRSSSSTCGDPSMNHATTEELSFARLMAVLSIIFVVCWVPQLTTIIVAQLVGSNPLYKEIYKVADLFIALNFTLDPYMYVLFRRQQRYTNRHLRKLMTYVCPYALQPSPRRALIGSVRSSSHTSHNTNGVCNGDAVAVSDAALGSSKCRGPSCRDRPLVMKETSVPNTRYPPTLPVVRKSMYPSNSFLPPRRPQKLVTNHQSSTMMNDTHLICKRTSRVSQENENFENMKLDDKKDITSYSLSKRGTAVNGLNTSKLEHYSYIVLQVGEGKDKKSWICMSPEEPFTALWNDDDDKENISTFKHVKRWSFCYGEDERLEILPKKFQKHDFRERTWLLQSWCKWKMPLWRSQGELWSKKLKTNV
ncbi:prostaglandin E2 receptor EP4 subtype isoform X3 [Cherax quadricarinatus]|uniref:prostaglandin E2 receptor EP4 subtype isoform X3 n=1 Tax=Cherax quadricarinatus TaxID=27406 RepID=UPI00387EB799